MTQVNWKDYMEPILLSIRVTAAASVIVFILGLLVAWLMTRRHWKGKLWLETLFLLPLVLPPSVVGFLLLVLLGRNSWTGRLFEAWFQQSILFTWYSAAIASVVVAFPLVYQTMKVGFASVDRGVIDAARCEGATESQLLRWILIPLAHQSLIAAYILGFARGLGEFGATIMIAGNIPGKTQTIPTAIYAAVDSGKLTLAWAWSLAIIVISLFMLWFANSKRS